MKRCNLAGLVLSTCLLTPGLVVATPITGSIEFTGKAQVNSGVTAFSGFTDPQGNGSEPVVKQGSQTIAYSGVPDGTAATWTPFQFVPPTASISPLWNFTYDNVTYSFAATSMSVSIATDGSLDITGNGIAHITGYDDTLGTWEVKSGPDSGSIFSFNATTDASGTPVPDGGTTVALLGMALAGVAFLRRQIA